MNRKQEELVILGAMFHWVSDIFYYEPTAKKLNFVLENVSLWPDDDNETQKLIAEILTSVNQDGFEKIKEDFYKLFIGPGKKDVYPWGSVYTDKENLLFGKSTILWEEFCIKTGIVISPSSNEPTDHFALVISAIAAILSSESEPKIKVSKVQFIFREHFSPWGLDVLSLVVQNASTIYYKNFAKLALKLIDRIDGCV